MNNPLMRRKVKYMTSCLEHKYHGFCAENYMSHFYSYSLHAILIIGWQWHQTNQVFLFVRRCSKMSCLIYLSITLCYNSTRSFWHMVKTILFFIVAIISTVLLRCFNLANIYHNKSLISWLTKYGVIYEHWIDLVPKTYCYFDHVCLSYGNTL